MPYKTSAIGGGKYRVTSPNGVKSKGTTKEKAKKQVNLLRGVEHGWKPDQMNKMHKKMHS